MRMTWEEEIVSEIHPRRIHLGNVGPRSVKIVLSPWPFLKVASQLGNGYGAKMKKEDNKYLQKLLPPH